MALTTHHTGGLNTMGTTPLLTEVVGDGTCYELVAGGRYGRYGHYHVTRDGLVVQTARSGAAEPDGRVLAAFRTVVAAARQAWEDELARDAQRGRENLGGIALHLIVFVLATGLSLLILPRLGLHAGGGQVAALVGASTLGMLITQRAQRSRAAATGR